MDASKFHWQDYMVFAIFCAINMAVGVAYAIRDKWGSQSTESYLMGNRRMYWLTIGNSICVSLINAVFVIGFSAEIYYMGMQIVWMVVGSFVGYNLVIFIIVPKYFRMGCKITSAYQYFELRFNLPVRMLASGIYTVGTLTYMSIVLYAPCILLAQVSDLDVRVCIVIGSAVCMVYTGLGGMKAVVLVDNIQVLTMLVGLFVLAVKGTLDAGGLQRVWSLFKEGGRTQALDMDVRLWDRHNVLNLIFSWIVTMAAMLGTQQIVIQRVLSVKQMRHAQWSLMIAYWVQVGIAALTVFIGVAAFALMGGYEPLLLGEISKPVQMFPLFMMRVLGTLPGLPGLLVAAAFAAGLSTVSSGQNSLATTILEDLVKPIYTKVTGRCLKEKKAGHICRFLGLCLGLPIMGIGVAVVNADDMLFSLARSVESFMIGPLMSLTISAMFIQFVEPWGAFIGLITSMLWGIQMYIGSLTTSSKIGYDFKPLYLNNFTVEIPVTAPNITPTLYDLSYVWYVTVDVLVGLLVSCVISLIVLSVKYRAALRTNRNAKWTDSITWKQHMFSKDDFLAGLGIKTNKNLKIDDQDPQELKTPIDVDTPFSEA